jgi:phosphate transport system substrate-binding protein
VIKHSLAFAAATAVVLAAGTAAAQSRDQIRIVGSSTVFPFSTAVAEQFGKTTDFPTPVVESTGSGGGLKLFCAGVGVEHPDITNASRRIKSSEYENCTNNGITITEVRIGFDGIVLANSKDHSRYELTKEQVFKALAKNVVVDGEVVENPYETWADIDPSLPNEQIEVLGPPPTSGTRDAFGELMMETGCEEAGMVDQLGEDACTEIREDGGYVEAGENDNLIVQKLQANPQALGIFGFSFLDQNRDALQGSVINGVEPTFDNIAAGDYGVSRSLYFYVKNEHVGVIPGIEEYIVEFTSEEAWGPDGYLADKGLIPLPEDARERQRDEARGLQKLTM